MVEPKMFYRELDSILAKIGREKSDKNFFETILNELEQKFGAVLNIANGYIYEQRGDEFILVHTLNKKSGDCLTKRIPRNAESIEQIRKSGRIIFSEPELGKDFGKNACKGDLTLAAISVHNPARQWIFVFQLKKGWLQEEVTLFLNAMRTALNYRLFSEMMRSDLKRAEQIQKSLLPQEVPKVKGYEMYGYSQPAEIVGGDFYDYFQFDEEDFGASIGDASGHGLPAALLVRDVVIGLRMGLAREMRLVHTIRKLNQVIQRSTYATNFVSLFIGEVESDGHFFFVNAGHPPPFLIAGNDIYDLKATGLTLGFMPEIELTRSYIFMKPGSVLTLYSDGIAERQDKFEEQFGMDKFKKLVSENQDKSAKDIVNIIFNAVYDFGGRTSWEDDATVIVIKRLADNK
ncbi:PP2C family protein-serine/threonine phosphatase [bacterium]|nr:PP2C family protein-serine/threonine phosphatase [bacterium]RQV94380.1 MAG: hypothetical protein EH221_07995 [bacterium]